jgi:hypothetical protein
LPESGWQPVRWSSERHAACPDAWRLTRTLPSTPHPSGVLHRSPAAPFTTGLAHRVAGGVTALARPGPRAPSPPYGVTPPRGVSPRPRPACPGPRRSAGLRRQTSTLARPPPEGLVRQSWPVAACPCGEAALPAVSASSSGEGLGPVPRRAAAGPWPVPARRTSASPDGHEVRRAATPALMATALPTRLRGCSHAGLCRRPPVLDPQVAPTAEAHSPLGSRAVDTTPCTCADPPRTVVSLRACIGHLARRDFHPLD